MNPGEIESLLADDPKLEAALADVREVDRERETWTFDDVPVDSGVFGELVGSGVVESVGEEYRIADPETVDRVLAGESVSESDDSSGIEVSIPEIDPVTAGALGLVIALTAVMRASNYSSVFRDRVVYAANDPYAYVYWVEEGLRNGWGPSNVPAGLSDQEPLTIVQLLYSAELAGGLGSHGAILAWSPVFAAVVTVLALYGFTHEVSGDRRIALASAFVLAVLPVHVLRSALGFVDHHPFDYVWLVVTAWGLTRAFGVESIDLEWRPISAIGLLGIGVAGSVLAWWAASLLLFPIAIAITIGGALAVRDERPFYQPGVTTALGVGLGALLVAFTHVAWGWHDRILLAIPIALTVGIVGIVGASALWRRLSLPAWSFPSTGIVGVAAVAAGVYRFAPEEWARISSQLTRLFGAQEIAEVQSIFDAESMGWLFSFGLVFFVILPAMAWGAYRAYSGDRRWLVASSYAWFLLFLAGTQARYAGEFSPFAALFGGVALLFIAERVEASRAAVPFGGEDRPLSIPDRDVALRLAGVVVLVCGLSIAMAPIAANNVAIPDEQYETAAFIADDAAAAGHEYPDSYVFSPWSWSRMYNYHVNGQAGSYGYAQAHYREFTVYEDPDEAYQRISGGRAGNAYLVTEPFPGDTEVPETAMQSRLHDRYGSRGEGVEGLSHYRALYATDSGDYKAFRVVNGATIRGSADADSTVRLSTEVDIEGDSFTYEREAGVENGSFAVTVPYPGEYELEGATAASVRVNESNVASGDEVRADGPEEST